MPSKSVLVVIAVVAMMAMGVGAYVGTELGAQRGQAGVPTPTPEANGVGGDTTPTPTPMATPTPSPTPTPVQTVAASEFDEATIRTNVLAVVNSERRARGLSNLTFGSDVTEMAQFHSENMAQQGFVSHVAAGFDTKERYDRYDIGASCRIVDDSGESIRSGRELELVGKTTAGRPFEYNGEQRHHRDEAAVARAVVDRWLADDDANAKLFYKNANEAGVGIVVTENGGVYATLDLCGR